MAAPLLSSPTCGNGSLSRRALLERGLRLGLAPPVAAMLAASSLHVVEAQEEGDTLTVMVVSNRFDLDPHSSGSDASLLFFGCYELLLRLDGASADRFAPMLADSWEQNADGSSYTFHLPPDARFHDGSPCDAAAVKASFERLLGLAATPVYIVGRFVTDPGRQIVVVDDTTVRFDLDRPQPLFLSALASPYAAFVVNPNTVAEHRTEEDPWAHEWLTVNTAGTGTGPYEIVEHLPGERTVLRRFDGYHRGWEGNHLAQIEVRVVETDATRRLLLEQGGADAVTRLLTPDAVEALAELDTLRVEIYDSFDVSWIVLNAPRLRTADVRRGFCYAFPYDDVLEGVYHGWLKRTGPLAELLRGYDPAVFRYPTDLARAQELIRSGGFAEGDSFAYMYLAGDGGSEVVAQLFQANLAEIGFGLELNPVEHGTRLGVAFGELPAEERPHLFGSWGWYPDYNDPWVQLAPTFLRSVFDGGEGYANVGRWVNERFEQIMAEAKEYTDEARLTELMREAQNILTEQDPPAIFLGQQLYATVLHADVRGFAGNPLYLNQFPFYQMWRE